MTRQQKIQELQEIWCRIVGSDHHKSSDVNHYISIRYTYGNVEYTVEHAAYCGLDINESFYTLAAAEDYLVQELIRQISSQLVFFIDDYSDNDKMQPVKYYLDLQKQFNKVKDVITTDELPEKTNWKEKYLEMHSEVQRLKFELKYADEVLTKLGVGSSIGASENFGMELSIGARILELDKKL